ncbi:aminopeptidase N [Marinicella litoralis]|uniref:Aminopeptidase N n=1 Tax=Marinicella litoralis TaxID=644220 RepID=A0A4R6XMF9_9GAMM|nr:aminopeptidase N [Marinicella litoralis]TDR20845.1 aminopeptidase N [Marinicella litoralis]
MSSSKEVIYRKDYQEPNYVVKSVDLAFVVEAESTLVTARIQFEVNPKQDKNELFLNGVDLELVSIELNQQQLNANKYDLNERGLSLHDLPDAFELKTVVKIYPSQNTALEGLYQSGNFFLTQCEAEGFRKITFYPDRPDVLAKFTVTIVADKEKYPVLLSNGNKISSGDLNDGRHYCKWLDPHPKPSYLFALVAGDLDYIEDHFITKNNNKVQLRIYTESKNIDACDFAMQSLINSMQWDEERFNLVYDLDEYNIVATDDFNMGAMENKGLNIFNSKYVLAKPETATDQDFINIEAVIGHEYFHNWTGNRVTCKDWFQLSLKEGLTVFRDQEFTADLQSRSVKRIEDVRYLRSAQFAEDASPMSHSVRPDSFIEINNFYTLTVYEKGSEVVRMYHTLLGEEGFQKGMQLYFKRHDGSAVSCNDFRLAMADANSVDLTQFELWYSQNGTPQVYIRENYDAGKKAYSIDFMQAAPDNYKGDVAWQPMHVPVKLALYDNEGNPLPLNDAGDLQLTYELKEISQTLTVNGVEHQPIASLFQGFSAPIKLHRQIGHKELAFLMKHDTDSFNRWDATQEMQSQIIIGKYQALLDNKNYNCPKYFIESFRHILLDDGIDSALIAEAITLPSVKSLTLKLAKVDVLKLFDAKEWLIKEIAYQLEVELLSVYNQNYDSSDYRVNSEQVAKRSLKNRCLSFLLQSNKKEFAGLAKDQFIHAGNYTDKMTALSLLTHQQVDGFEDLLGAYFTEWQDNPLVINKWLSIQATIPASDTLIRVKQLMELPVFSMKNPNAVRSLIGAFCGANITQFHAEDSSGYQFLADQIIELDRINPQIAARLAGLFNDYHQYNDEIQHRMNEQIKRIHTTDGLSPNVFEIIDRAVGSIN